MILRIIAVVIAIVICTFVTHILKKKMNKNKTNPLLVVISVILTIALALFNSLAVDWIKDVIVKPIPTSSIEKYDFDTNIIGKAQPSFNNLNCCEVFFHQYINQLPKVKASNDSDLLSNKEVIDLIGKREQTTNLKKKVMYSKQICEIISNNAAIINTYAILSQDYAIELYSLKDKHTEKAFLETIAINFRLLSLTECCINRSDIYYRIGQCFEYLSLPCPDMSSRNTYQDSLCAIVFFKFSYQSTDYDDTLNFGCPYAMSGIIAHRIATQNNYDPEWLNFAIKEYDKALEQLPINNLLARHCLKGKADIDTIITTRYAPKD